MSQTERPVLLALDPGLDGTGYAIWRVPERRLAVLQDYRGQLVDSGTITTRPLETDTGIAVRLALLATSIEGLIHQYTVTHCAVERSATSFAYASREARDKSGRGRMNAASMRLNWLACGVCLAICGQRAYTFEVTAPKVKKRQRHTAIQWLTNQLGRTNEDERDALDLGLRVLLDGRRQWTT